MHRLICATLAALLAGSGAARADDCSDAGLGELGGPLIEHSCFHTTNGPFAERTATVGGAPSAATPNVDAVHTHYTIAIDPARSNVVTYAPVRSGNWAIFGDRDVPHELLDAAGAPLPVKLTHTVAGCPALPVVRVFALTAQARYTLRLGPAASSGVRTTHVVIEKVSDFEAQHGRDDDGDGFGGASDTVTTACAPPPGYVRSVTDCDDGDPAIHPEAMESCNGVDDNCNGLGDEDACTVGGGGCDSGPPSASSSASLAIALLLVPWLLWVVRRRRAVERRPR